MSASSRDALVRLLVSAYPELKRRLSWRLGSAELAGEALQDTYVRLARADIVGEVRNPRSYLLRMAINIASNRARSEARHLSAADVELLIDVRDEAPDPARVIEARSELEAVRRALERLPLRRRTIFLRSWMDNNTLQEISWEFNIAVRTVRYELMLATRHLHDATRDFGVEELQDTLARVSSL